MGKLSFFCEHGDHEECSHSLRPRVRDRALVSLCTCACHEQCPLGGQTEAPEQQWIDDCACPGSVEKRQREKRTQEVIAGIDFGRGKSAEEIERMLRDGYVSRGWEPPKALGWVSRFAAAGTAHRGRGARLLLETGRAIHAATNELRALGKVTSPEWLKPPPGHEVGVRSTDSASGTYGIIEAAEVDLADDIQPFLAKAFEALLDPEWDDEDETDCQVWIDTRQPMPSGAPLPVILGTEPIGTLTADALALERELHKAGKRQQPLILEATIERERGQFGVSVVVPPTD